MLFNSLLFWMFFLVVYLLYLLSPHKLQNKILLVASYVFYGSWDWRFLSLLWFSTVLDYFFGLKIFNETHPGRRKFWLICSLTVNLTILGVFKYFNFFLLNLKSLFGTLGWNLDATTLHIILPLGISFYTFQSISYIVDIYRGEIKPAKNLSDFALFVAFFPHLIAGPIVRAKRLLSQITQPRFVTRDKIYEGTWLIVWGLYKKVFIADNLGRMVSRFFLQTSFSNGTETLLALYAFAFQIYGDFSGYSDMARGLAKLMGFELSLNFNLPYFATNPRDFWQRWHITLSEWLRDYLYIPLGGSRKGTLRTVFNLMVTMIVAGLWHGAAWTFVVWGVYQGLLLAIYHGCRPFFPKLALKTPFLKGLWLLLRILLTFHAWCLGLLVFRATSLSQAWKILQSFTPSFSVGGTDLLYFAFKLFFFTWFLILIQMFKKFRDDAWVIFRWPLAVRIPVYLTVFYSILWFGAFGGKQFIYFQF